MKELLDVTENKSLINLEFLKQDYENNLKFCIDYLIDKDLTEDEVILVVYLAYSYIIYIIYMINI